MSIMHIQTITNARKQRSEIRLQISDAIFDSIESPQYLSFAKGIPEAPDTFFERRLEDKYLGKSPKFKKLQELPSDPKEDLRKDNIKPCSAKEKDSITDDENNNSQNLKLPDDFGDDLIRGIRTLQVDNESGESIKQEKIITSTPFRIQGIEPMPWRPVVKLEKNEANHCTIPKPFSFEERNKQMVQRKARRVQMILQAEKEARKFRANPIPKFLQKSINTKNHLSQNATLESIRGNKTFRAQQPSSAPPSFKARSPKVLRKPAFQPILPTKPLPAPQPFVLFSELRAKERAVFDNCIKEKERLNERLRELREGAQKRREQDEIVKMRKEMVPKAQPIPKFKCTMKPIAKRPLTEPTTPKVLKRQRR